MKDARQAYAQMATISSICGLVAIIAANIVLLALGQRIAAIGVVCGTLGFLANTMHATGALAGEARKARYALVARVTLGVTSALCFLWGGLTSPALQ